MNCHNPLVSHYSISLVIPDAKKNGRARDRLTSLVKDAIYLRNLLAKLAKPPTPPRSSSRLPPLDDLSTICGSNSCSPLNRSF